MRRRVPNELLEGETAKHFSDQALLDVAIDGRLGQLLGYGQRARRRPAGNSQPDVGLFHPVPRGRSRTARS